MQRARDQSSFRAFPRVHPGMSKTTITPPCTGLHSKRIAKRARPRLRGANIRGMQCRGKRTRNVSRLSRGLSPFVENRSTFYVPAYGGGKPRRSLLDSSELYRQRKSTSGQKGRRTRGAGGARDSSMNHRFNPRRIIRPMTRERPRRNFIIN